MRYLDELFAKQPFALVRDGTLATFSQAEWNSPEFLALSEAGAGPKATPEGRRKLILAQLTIQASRSVP